MTSKIFKGCQVVFEETKRDLVMSKLIGLVAARDLCFENRYATSDDGEATVYISTNAWGMDLFIRDYLSTLVLSDVLWSVSFGTMQAPGTWVPSINQRGGH